jgi:hypothetical protein
LLPALLTALCSAGVVAHAASLLGCTIVQLALLLRGIATLHSVRCTTVIISVCHFTSFREDRVTHLGFGDVDKKYL